jgi:hypothetical protein
MTRSCAALLAMACLAGCHDNGNGNPDLSASGDLGAGGGGGSGGGMVMGHARILHGPSTVMHARQRGGPPGPTPRIADGHWALSPDQARVTVDSLTFQGATAGDVQAVMLTNCKPTYVRDQPSLSTVLDCPFMIPAGTYVGMGVAVAATFDVLVDDATAGLYTDPAAATKLSTTAPAGGAPFVSITVATGSGTNGELSQQTFFSHPVTLTPTGSVGGDDGGAEVGVTVDVAVDLTHTIFANVSGGSASFDTSLPLPAVQLMASLEGAGHVQLYSASGTAGSALMPGPTDDDTSSVRVFFDGSGAASYEFHPTLGPSQAWNANPAGGTGNRAGGYLGVDGSGTLCWAIPQDYTYAQYAGICELATVSTIGATTTLRCATTTTVPPPTSGDTYASGCPTLTNPTSTTVTLIAQ